MSAFSEKTRYAMQMGQLENKSHHVDARPFYVKAADYLPITIGWIIGSIGILVCFKPEYAYFLFCLGLPLFFYGLNKQLDYFISAPMAKDTLKRKAKERRGKRTKLKKPSAESKSGFFLKRGDALMLVGYDLLFGRQLWIDLDRETRMSLITGTTGAGKTVTLCTSLFQACIQGHLKGGAPIYLVDGKGSVEGLYDFLFYIWRTGRIHDFRLLNFLTGGEKQDVNKMLDEDMTTNCFNPFSDLNDSECTVLVLSFGKSSEGGNNEYFRDRAANMLSGIFPVLCYKRDEQGEHLDITVLQQSLGLRECLALASDNSIPKDVRKPLQDYLKTLNAIDDAVLSMSAQDVEINSKADEQHTYNKSMVSKTVNEMAGKLGHIFSSVGSDLNTRSVISHGQIAIILLPTIEKDPDSMAELGRMLVGSLRPAFQSAFGYKSQGLKEATVGGLPTQRLVPVRVYLDEVMNYYTKGIASFLSLLRSLKITITLLGQSMKGLEDAGISEGRQTLANLNNKYMFSSQDVYETFEVLSKSLGKMPVTRLSEMNQNNWGAWKGGERLQTSDEAILNERDMASADAMEGLYLYRGAPVPMKSATFFAEKKRDGELDSFFLNHFAELMLPDEDDLARVYSILNFEDECLSGDLKPIEQESNPNAIIDAFVDVLAGLHEAVCTNSWGDVYSHQNILSYAFIDHQVQADLRLAKKTQDQLSSEADQERQSMKENRTAAQEAIMSEQGLITDDDDGFWKDLVQQNMDVIGVDEDAMQFTPLIDDDTDEHYQTDDESTTDDASNSTESTESEKEPTQPEPTEKSAGGLLVSKSRAQELDSKKKEYRYGRVETESSDKEDTNDDDSSNNDSASKGDDKQSESSGGLKTERIKDLAKRTSEITGVSSDQIISDVYNVKIYPTNPLPKALSDQQHESLVSDVADEFDEAITRLKQDSAESHNDLLNQFLD
ncbi:type IV secretory system conjugative DNA transfer family protein [Vibrio agarivorans]|uniref:type IV secretory system conjugative DNA transfer family protein n=1 Tax=Vibrio agarivorans TaxID=153622 RepID=UPI0025B626B4|nr:TraM recognition domain-containing protein [Vibrio agarivorans]MDN3661059.1 TraM recognition domain-containing protein [Vibrio agarivorans]